MARKLRPSDIVLVTSSSDDETEDQNGSSSSTDDEQHAQHPQEKEESDDDEPPQESDDDSDETQNPPSAFTVKPVVSKSTRAKRSAESEEIDIVSKPVLKNQDPGKVKGGNSKRPAETEVGKIDKVKKNKKSKVYSVGEVEKGSKKGKNTIMEVKTEETQDFWSLYPRLCASLESEAAGFLAVRARDIKEYAKEIINMIGEEKAREVEDGWKAVFVMEQQVDARRAHLINKQGILVDEMFKKVGC